VVALLAAGENVSVRPVLSVPSSARTDWSAWLRRQPTGTVVAHVPFPAGFTPRDYEVETRRMFAQIYHQKPLVNGYSSYFPAQRGPGGRVIPAYLVFQLEMAREFPNYRLLCTLTRGVRANTLVVDRGWLAS